VGIDITPEQLATARALQAEHGLDFPLIEGSAEAVALPTTPSTSRSLSSVPACGAIRRRGSRGGAPAATGCRLWFLTNTPLSCSPCMTRTSRRREARPPAVRHARFQWSDGSVEFHLPHGELIALLGRCGFTIEALHELQAPAGATTRYEWVTPEWAHRGPPRRSGSPASGAAIGRRLSAASRPPRWWPRSRHRVGLCADPGRWRLAQADSVPLSYFQA